MTTAKLINSDNIESITNCVIFDCRFSLADPDQGRVDYLAGHIPRAQYIDLGKDLSGPIARHGGRHPLPSPADFAATLASYGVGPQTNVIAYDDHGLAYAARLWWMMRSLGFKPPWLLNGGYRAWIAGEGQVETAIPVAEPCSACESSTFDGWCDIEGLRMLQGEGALVIDSREERRYQGLEEPIDPIAGHIPGAINCPWLNVAALSGDVDTQRANWGDILEADKIVVYCGSGVTACVNLFSLAMSGRDDAVLYAGSWSDWCSHL
ncbi:MAG: sulfurtransferase [Halieaceae bacterium]|jgi:thiosulfate/3-mercaptopyruvate sulfurtransferase|nr:sulfurtransferase [Halieaceae bacterium]